jgi:DNA primase
MSTVDDIKAKLSIEDLVSQYVQLKKVGRSLKGLCPFHAEKTPSFIVSPEKGIAYCFGCNKGGDVFRFIQEIEGVDFVDALKILAERTGVKLEKDSYKPTVPVELKEQLIELHEETASFYQEQLWETDDGAKVIEYLHKRGLTDESIKLFRLGFSPDSYDVTHQQLLKRGFTKRILLLAGLVLTKETTVENVYDRFRGRLMFPIFDSLGRVVAFEGRALKKEQEPKYLNSPETAIYHKSNVLYGLNFAKNFIRETEEAVFVEGYMDLIMSFQDGVKNVVATSGTALNVQQLRLLKPFASVLHLAFDMDMAGREAVKRAFEMSVDFDYTIKVVSLPEGKDPGEYTNMHPGEFQRCISDSMIYGDYFYKELFQAYGTATSAAKKKIVQEFLPFFHLLKSNIEKDAYIRKLALDLDLKEVQIYDEIKAYKLPMGHPARLHSTLNVPTTKAKKYTAEELLLGLLIEFPRLAKFFMEKISENMFTDRLKPIYKVLADQYNGQGAAHAEAVIACLPHELKEEAGLLSLYVNENYGEIGEEVVEKEMNSLMANLKKHIYAGRSQQLQKNILEAEKSGDKELSMRLLRELGDLHQSSIV